MFITQGICLEIGPLTLFCKIYSHVSYIFKLPLDSFSLLRYNPNTICDYWCIRCCALCIQIWCIFICVDVLTVQVMCQKHMPTLKLICNVIFHHGLYLSCWFIENLLRTCERNQKWIVAKKQTIHSRNGCKSILNNIMRCNPLSTMGVAKEVNPHGSNNWPHIQCVQPKTRGWGRPNIVCIAKHKTFEGK